MCDSYFLDDSLSIDHFVAAETNFSAASLDIYSSVSGLLLRECEHSPVLLSFIFIQVVCKLIINPQNEYRFTLENSWAKDFMHI